MFQSEVCKEWLPKIAVFRDLLQCLIFTKMISTECHQLCAQFKVTHLPVFDKLWKKNPGLHMGKYGGTGGYV